MSALVVVRPGLLTTIQDRGRWGHQSDGVAVAGPMDEYSHRLANLLVGNPEEAAALEITLLGPEIVCEGGQILAVCGMEIGLTLNGRTVPAHTPFAAPDGATLKFGARRRGARGCLAVAGGIDVPAVLGSRATHLVSRMGPLGGRALTAGDRLVVGRPAGAPARGVSGPALSLPDGGARLRVLPGPQEDRFTARALQTLRSARYVVSSRSNRMGYLLDGPALEHAGSADILSDPTAFGAIQVPASGQPILLMADRQTTGGYPKVATVISADLPLAGQLAPGDWIEFEICAREEAIAALAQQDAALRGIRPARPSGPPA